MAELVQQAMEGMVGELEQLKRTSLLSAAEVTALRRKREAHEYKLQKRKKAKEDFLAYIQEELTLLDLIEIRRQVRKRHLTQEARNLNLCKIASPWATTARRAPPTTRSRAASTACSRCWSTGSTRTPRSGPRTWPSSSAW